MFGIVGEELRLPVSSQDYLTKLVEYGMMKLHAAASVKETNQSWIEEDDFQVLMPSIEIMVRFELHISLSDLKVMLLARLARSLPIEGEYNSRIIASWSLYKEMYVWVRLFFKRSPARLKWVNSLELLSGWRTR